MLCSSAAVLHNANTLTVVPHELLTGGSNLASVVCEIPTAIRKRPQRSAHGQRQQVGHPDRQLLATLLVHAQYQGYWNQLGMQFREEMEALLERHLLNGLVEAPWVRTDDPESDDDDGFFAALQELVAYAFEESARIKKKGRLFPGWHEKSVRSSGGILQEVQSLLQKYRSELVSKSHCSIKESRVIRAHQPGSEPIYIPETIPIRLYPSQHLLRQNPLLGSRYRR